MAFLKTSRYHGLPTVDAPARGGRTVTAVALRPLPPTPGEPYRVQEDDRLDLIADRAYGDPTRFWRIADANSELEAARLLEPGRDIGVPPTK
jgi:nucleoid-associated protein YgaU